MPRIRKIMPTALFPFEKYQPTTPAHRVLLLKCPLFFRAVRQPDAMPCDLSYWGIRCGPGWLPILEDAIELIEQELRTMMKKWESLDFFFDLEHRMITKTLIPVASGLTVPESLNVTEPVLLPYCNEISVNESGDLQIGITSGYLCDEKSSHAIAGLVFAARMGTGVTCERCGAPADKWRGYWRRVYCARCAGMPSVFKNDKGQKSWQQPPSPAS